MTAGPILILYSHLVGMTVDSPSGSPAVDAEIASVLSVPSLPYTSNDTDAQTLLPSGWSWSTSAAETIICVRNSDSLATGDMINADGSSTVISLPDPLERCLAAVAAYMLEGNIIA